MSGNGNDSFSEYSSKRFFGTDDVRDGALVLEIASFGKETVTQDGKEQNINVVRFKDQDRGVILKSTTLSQLKELFGTPSSAVGKNVELYFDASVSFGGKKVGGLRFRAPGTNNANKAPF